MEIQFLAIFGSLAFSFMWHTHEIWYALTYLNGWKNETEKERERENQEAILKLEKNRNKNSKKINELNQNMPWKVINKTGTKKRQNKTQRKESSTDRTKHKGRKSEHLNGRVVIG